MQSPLSYSVEIIALMRFYFRQCNKNEVTLNYGGKHTDFLKMAKLTRLNLLACTVNIPFCLKTQL